MQIAEYFRDKGCVVTGAASGIGLAVSEALLQTGAIVFLADQDTKTLVSAAERLSAHAKRVHSVSVDVTNQEQVHRLIHDAASRHGRLDFLFNNAGSVASFRLAKPRWSTGAASSTSISGASSMAFMPLFRSCVGKGAGIL